MGGNTASPHSTFCLFSHLTLEQVAEIYALQSTHIEHAAEISALRSTFAAEISTLRQEMAATVAEAVSGLTHPPTTTAPSVLPTMSTPTTSPTVSSFAPTGGPTTPPTAAPTAGPTSSRFQFAADQSIRGMRVTCRSVQTGGDECPGYVIVRLLCFPSLSVLASQPHPKTKKTNKPTYQIKRTVIEFVATVTCQVHAVQRHPPWRAPIPERGRLWSHMGSSGSTRERSGDQRVL